MKWWKFFLMMMGMVSLHSSYSQTEVPTIISILHEGSVTLAEPTWVTSFYAQRNFEASWSRENAAMFIAALHCATDEGLNPEDYRLSTLERLSRQQLSKEEKLQYDILLTDAFMHYSVHLSNGKIDPSILYDGAWEPHQRRFDFAELLTKALLSHTIVATIQSFQPAFREYQLLKRSLQWYYYLLVTKAWPVLEEGVAIEPGMYDNRMPSIRRRFILTNDLKESVLIDTLTLYDSSLAEVIKSFQSRYGLEADGIIGKQTIAALNLTPADHIQKIIINMERYRWLPPSIDSLGVIINIPEYALRVMRNDSLIMAMKAIVGRTDRQTPVISSSIQYVILNPTWVVPPTILKEDVLPAVKKNLNYLKKNNLKVLNKWGEEIDPEGLPWHKFNERNFPYRLVQDPGPNNSLGLIKFQFPNNHKVFLHDTNHRNLFAATNRALSSGCIRIEQPFTLAAWLLQGTNWSQEKLERFIESEKTSTVVLPKPVPVHTVYFTAFHDDTGVLQWRKDIYNWDKILVEAFPITVW